MFVCCLAAAHSSFLIIIFAVVFWRFCFFVAAFFLLYVSSLPKFCKIGSMTKTLSVSRHKIKITNKRNERSKIYVQKWKHTVRKLIEKFPIEEDKWKQKKNFFFSVELSVKNWLDQIPSNNKSKSCFCCVFFISRIMLLISV